MIGQCLSSNRYNLIIMAGGKGSRMGDSANYLPMALAPIGDLRAIDWIITRHEQISENIVIGISTHGDLIKSHVNARYPGCIFSHEDELVNNAYSLTYCLDHVDSRLPTIITFCDLLLMDNFRIDGDRFYYVDEFTKGNCGTFRHGVDSDGYIIKHDYPISKIYGNGLLGYFVINDTRRLKAITYNALEGALDLTDDILIPYYDGIDPKTFNYCSKVYEFGTENDLNEVRKLWEMS